MLHLPSAIFYATMSIFMVFSNKYVISTWGFNNPIILILLEMFLNLLIIHSIDFYRNRRNRQHKGGGTMNSGGDTTILAMSYSKDDHDLIPHSPPLKKPLTLGLHLETYTKYQYLIVLFYCFHSVLSLKALSGLNIPMYVMFKRCVPLANLIISMFIFKNVNLKGK